MDVSEVLSSVASPAHLNRKPLTKRAAVKRKAAQAVSRRPPSAVSGRLIEAIWACKARKMSDSLYQMISRAQAAHARCIDDDRLEEWPSHFHGSCVYKITTAANLREGLEGAIIFANSKGMLYEW